MENTVSHTVQNTIKHWYVPLIVGLLFIGIAIYMFNTPFESYKGLSMIFSLSFLFSGVIEILFSISTRNKLDNWKWTLIFGVASSLVGLLLLTRPGISMIVLSVFIGVLVLSRSVAAVSFAFDLRKHKATGWANLLLIGILGIALSFTLLINPVITGITLVLLTSLTLFSAGIFSVFLAVSLKKLK